MIKGGRLPLPPPRKAIQIATKGGAETVAIVALCDDGTIWVKSWSTRGGTDWQVLKPIPSDTDLSNYREI